MARRRKMSAEGKRNISRGRKRYFARLKKQSANLPVPAPNGPAPAQDNDLAITAACFGYCVHAVEEHARRAGLPAAVLAERVGALLLGQAGR
jgi:hypothetical protein